MRKKILITDSLFIFSEHEKMLAHAGYETERLDTPTASEDQLIKHLKGKVGYILGGIEKVTDKVIDAAGELKAIVFTGADWRFFIPGHKLATTRGIAIANAPGANSYAVAEYTITLMLAMIRNIFISGRTGDVKFLTTPSLNDQTIGIVGMGSVGLKVAQSLRSLGAKEILYYSRTRKPEIEQKTGVKFVSLEKLLSKSDIITLHVSREAGMGFVGKNELAKMKAGALIINCGFTGGIDKDALFNELQSGRLRAAQDDPMDERFNALPLSHWFNSNSHGAYNTFEANKIASDMATKSLLSLLATGKDQYRVN